MQLLSDQMHKPLRLQTVQLIIVKHFFSLTRVATQNMQIQNYAKSVFKMSLCTQDKKVEWPHAGRKSVLLIPVSCKTFVSLFSPAGPLRSPPVLRLTSDRAAPLSISKPSGRAFDSCVTLPGCSREVLPSTHLVVTSAVRLGGGREQQGAARLGYRTLPFSSTQGASDNNSLQHLIEILQEKPLRTSKIKTQILLSSW